MGIYGDRKIYVLLIITLIWFGHGLFKQYHGMREERHIESEFNFNARRIYVE